MSSLFALGSNGSGQLGVGHEDDVNVPTKVIWKDASQPSASVRKVVAGGNHTIVLLADGQAWFTGDSSDGRCFSQGFGRTNVLNPVSFTGALLGAKIAICACTWEATIAVLENGRVVASGTGHRGELGLGLDISNASQTQVLRDFPPLGTTVIDLAASMNHVVAILSNGDVYGWGAGRKGQLGSRLTDSWQPRKLDSIMFPAQRAVVGTNFSVIFGAAATGQLLILGSDKWDLTSGQPPNISSWIDVTSSWGSVFVLMNNGRMLSWGRNDHHQLPPSIETTVTAVAAGSEHAIALTTDSRVLVWGWGEHGNCGPHVDPTTFDCESAELILPGKATFIGAGCATTWIGLLNDSP